MANPATIDGAVATLTATSTPESVALNPHRAYSLGHTQLDSAGAASTHPVFISTDGASTPDAGEGDHLGVVIPGMPVPLRRGVTTLSFATLSGEACLLVVES